MDGFIWLLFQLALLLAITAAVFFVLGWKIRGRGVSRRFEELEARVDGENRARQVALEERDAARDQLRERESTEGESRATVAQLEEAEQQQRLFEREILRLNDELKAAKAAAKPARGRLDSGGDDSQEPEVDASVAGEPDDLTQIKGIGAVIAKKLSNAGVTRFEQIAGWSDEDVAAFSERLSFRGRVNRDEWREQARALIGADR